MTPKKADKQIRRILTRFDFVRVRLAMQDMRWEWVPWVDCPPSTRRTAYCGSGLRLSTPMDGRVSHNLHVGLLSNFCAN